MQEISTTGAVYSKAGLQYPVYLRLRDKEKEPLSFEMKNEEFYISRNSFTY
jgi:hypothetical protein